MPLLGGARLIVSAASSAGLLLLTAGAIRVYRKAYAIKKRQERTTIAFNTIQILATLFGTYMIAQRANRLEDNMVNLHAQESRPANRRGRRRMSRRQRVKRETLLGSVDGERVLEGLYGEEG